MFGVVVRVFNYISGVWIMEFDDDIVGKDIEYGCVWWVVDCIVVMSKIVLFKIVCWYIVDDVFFLCNVFGVVVWVMDDY